ncbi:iron-sulfur cluster carrier protein ApbC [Neptunicella sp. SCSIO 80796]|uniref:iron-sulfur cluster carrier protein ApbC n=1 Tax=Neptunicella plasticusilytica TaxID=3117012 RepID=UPI003A4DCB37
MIFGKKQLTDEVCRQIQQEIGQFYAIPPSCVGGWLSAKNNKLSIEIPFAASSQLPSLQSELQQWLHHQSLDKIELAFSQSIMPLPTNNPPIPCIKNVLAVASGKGGVGKSTSAVNLAYALIQEGATVGILDADIYGPSIPIMLGNPNAQPDSDDGRHMQPLQSHGLVANSIGYLVPAEDAAIWRGPMASKALQQLLMETAWPALDYLIVDMPPGTGDIQLTLSKSVPVSGAVIVTTPQDIALADALKGITMFNKVDVPVLGIIENMSYYQCRQCGHKEMLFASEGGVKLAKDHQVELLGQLPLDIVIREHADKGEPLLISEPDSPLSASYRAAARNMSKQLYLQSLKPGQKISVTNLS